MGYLPELIGGAEDAAKPITHVQNDRVTSASHISGALLRLNSAKQRKCCERGLFRLAAVRLGSWRMAQFGHERTQAESRKAGKGNHIRIHGKDVSGHILVSDDDVEVHVHVGFAMMFREPIRVAIEGSIAKHIA